MFTHSQRDINAITLPRGFKKVALGNSLENNFSSERSRGRVFCESARFLGLFSALATFQTICSSIFLPSLTCRPLINGRSSFVIFFFCTSSITSDPISCACRKPQEFRFAEGQRWKHNHLPFLS
ncbi:hypothetical protein CDAR_365651 [Caerostris darwini]|uniref:Uncharacterized protein n=1 Tax=Caerostris darwini TaxID=1538125 RepID=A0AAV4RI28_9ARAC|nr:hypothetical protein CDAR_365651 [Caerostris darwini]